MPTEMIHCGKTQTARLAVLHGLTAMLAGTGITVNSMWPVPTHSLAWANSCINSAAVRVSRHFRRNSSAAPSEIKLTLALGRREAANVLRLTWISSRMLRS